MSFSPAAAQEISEAEQREKQVVDRFWNVLCRTPRFGTAFDRVYSFHLDRGTLDQLTEDARLRMEALEGKTQEKEFARAELLYGLILLRRGHLEPAIETLEHAEKTLENDPYPAWYLAEAYLSQDRLKEAAEALEKAQKRVTAGNTPKTERLKMFHSLGTVYEKLGERKKAEETWSRLENAFPDDIDVLARIALTQEREGKFDEALKRYEKLVALTEKKPERRFRFQAAAAEMKIQLGHRREALDDLNSLLDMVSSSGWSSDFVRNRIDSLFMRQSDDAGLVGFYEKRLKEHPDDLESLRRLAVLLSRMSRSDEAKTCLEQGIVRSPSHVPLRLALVDLLESEHNLEKAREQYETIHELDPTNPDVLIRWGRAFLRDTEMSEEVRRENAVKIWNRLLENTPDDVPTLLLVAELCASENIAENAEKCFRRAVELQPNNIELYEKLGRFYRRENKPEKVVETLKKIVEGSRRNADSLLRLSDIFRSLEMTGDAVETLQNAVELAPNRFELRMRLVDLLFEKRDFDAVGRQLAESEKLAESDEEQNLLVPWEARWLKSTHQLDKKIEELKHQRNSIVSTLSDEKNRQDRKNTLAEIEWKLAVFYASQGDNNEAARCVEQGLEFAPDSKRLLRTAADIVPKTDDYRRAETIFRRLIEKDTARKSEHLKNLALLRRDFGDSDGAIETARQLQNLGSGNAINRRFLAEILFTFGKNEEAIEELRFALRFEPNDKPTLEMLADALFRLGRSEEALELAWRLYNRAGTLDAKLDDIRRLTEFHSRTLRLDELIEKLQTTSETLSQQRDATFCVARVFRTIGDYGKARETLEFIFDETDTPLLQELSVLSELQGDRENAIRFQEILCRRDASPRHSERLLVLYEAAGKKEKVAELSEKIETARRESLSALAAQTTPQSTPNTQLTPRNVQDVLASLEPVSWQAQLSLDENFQAFDQSLETTRNRFRTLLESEDCVVDEQELERLLDTCAKSGAGMIREAAKRLFTINELRKTIDDSIARWSQAAEKVPFGPRTLRIIMNIRNEKAIVLLGKEAQSRKHPMIDRKLLDACDRFEQEIRKTVQRQNALENELTGLFEKRFPLSKIEDRSVKATSWFSVADLKRYLNRTLNLPLNSPLNSPDEFSKSINVNMISYILSRSEFSMPSGLHTIPEERLLETACGALVAVDDFLESEAPVEGIARSDIRTDRKERFLNFLEHDLKTGKRMNARKSLVQEIDAASRLNTESAENVYEAESLDTVKRQAEKMLRVFETNTNTIDPTPLFSSLVMIALAENEPENALNFLLRIPCRTPLDIKARDLLVIRLSQRFTDSQAWKKNRDESLQRLLGYRLSEEELFEFWTALKSLHFDVEAANLRNRLVSTASKPAVVAALLDDLNEENDHDENNGKNSEKHTEQAVFLALKVLRSSTGSASSTESTAKLMDELTATAIETLSKNGKLGEVLDQFELQFQNVPGSVEFAERLADLYFRLDRRDDARNLALKIGEMLQKRISGNELFETEPVFRYIQLLNRLGMNEESQLWTKKNLVENPALLFRDYTKYAESLGDAAMLEILGNIDIKTISQNAFSTFRILENIIESNTESGETIRADAVKRFEEIWAAEGLSPQERNRFRETGVRTFFINNDRLYYSFASDWFFETLSLSEKAEDENEENEVPDLFRVWRWANHDPKTVTGSLIDLAKECDQLGTLEERIQNVVQQYEKQGDVKDWRRYTSAKVMQAAIAFERNQSEQGFQILDVLQARKDCEETLKSASLFLGFVVESCSAPQAVERATAYYEQAFRLNPHRAYEPFFTAKLYSLYLRSRNPDIQKRAVPIALKKFRDSFEMLAESFSDIRKSGTPTPETLMMFIGTLGRALVDADQSENVLTICREFTDNQNFQTEFKKFTSEEKNQHFVPVLEAVSTYATQNLR